MIPLKRVAVPLLGGAFQVVLVVKNLPANVEDLRDVGLIPGLGRSPPLIGERSQQPKGDTPLVKFSLFPQCFW